MSTWHGLAGATPAAESGGDTSWMRNAEDWTNRLERAAILPSERPTYHQATLSGGAGKELSVPEPMQKPLSYVNGSSLPDAADKPFQELAQKVERLERAVQDLQGWRVALASQAPLPPQPMDAAGMRRPVPPSPQRKAVALTTHISNKSPQLHHQSATVQPVGHNTTGLANGRLTDAAGDIIGESSKAKQDTNIVQLAESDLHTAAAVATSTPITDFPDAAPSEKKWHRQHGVYRLQSSLWDGTLCIGYATCLIHAHSFFLV